MPAKSILWPVSSHLMSAQAAVENLGEQPYLDNLDGRSRKTQPAGPLHFDGEVDRIFVGAPEDIKVALAHALCQGASHAFQAAACLAPPACEEQSASCSAGRAAARLCQSGRWGMWCPQSVRTACTHSLAASHVGVICVKHGMCTLMGKLRWSAAPICKPLCTTCRPAAHHLHALCHCHSPSKVLE
jgi:hypothetical protein